MKLKVLFFASARELTGETEWVLDIEPGTSTEKIPSLLMDIFPDLDIHRDRMAIAINQVYCNQPTILNENDVVAILPPISGG